MRRNARLLAALRGTEWLIDHAEQMPPGWAYPNFSRIERLIESQEQKEQVREVLEIDSRTGSHNTIPESLTDPALLEQKRIVPILFEIIRRREIGQAWKSEADALRKLITDHEIVLWQATDTRNRPTVLHALGALGIETSMTEAHLLDELRKKAESDTPQNLAGSTRYVYALTHIVFARSHYFRNQVQITGLEFSIPVFLAALARHNRIKLDVMSIDMLGEVLASLELLGLEDPKMEVARRRLIAAQNPDGSWGPGKGVSPKRIHPTFNAVAGLINFHEALRPPAGSPTPAD